MEAEDFSFPATAESRRFFIDSPPLWHISSSSAPPSQSATSCDEASEAYNTRETEHLKQGCLNEEKMDMLWEDFNEELLFMRMRNPNSGDAESNPGDCSKKMVQFGCGCVKALTISKGNNSSNRLGAVAVLKVLRKLFLILSSQRQLKKKKKHPW